MSILSEEIKFVFNKVRTHLIIICFAYICFGIYNYKTYGIRIVNDSARYIEYASSLQDGFFIDPHNFWYIGYPVYILIVKSLGGDIQIVVAGQYLLGLIAVISLYFTSLNIWKNPFSAFCTVLLFIFFIDTGQWTSYVLTESLYTSFICFSLFMQSLIYKGSNNKILYVITFITILFTCLIKPTGVALLGALLFVFLTYALNNVKSRLLRNCIRIICLTILLVLVNKMLTTFLIMENYQKGEIIYAITTLPPTPEYQMMVVTPPEDIYVPDHTMQPIIKIINFIFHHPTYWAHLFLAKVFFLLAHIRPYWSITHNLYSLAILIPCYYFFINAVRKEKPVIAMAFAAAYVVIHILSVAITSDDWDGRFLIPMLPVIFLVAGRGFIFSISKVTFT